MNIDIKDIIELDDNKSYVVTSKTTYNNKNYYYILELNNKSNFKFLYEDNNSLIEEDNEEVLKELVPLFLNASREAIKDLNINDIK